jgi:hypothetical protein
VLLHHQVTKSGWSTKWVALLILRWFVSEACVVDGAGSVRLPGRVRVGLACEGARGGFAAAQVAVVGGVPGRPSWPRRRREKPMGAAFP